MLRWILRGGITRALLHCLRKWIKLLHKYFSPRTLSMSIAHSLRLILLVIYYQLYVLIFYNFRRDRLVKLRDLMACQGEVNFGQVVWSPRGDEVESLENLDNFLVRYIGRFPTKLISQSGPSKNELLARGLSLSSYQDRARF